MTFLYQHGPFHDAFPLDAPQTHQLTAFHGALGNMTTYAIAEASISGACLLVYFTRFLPFKRPQWASRFAREPNPEPDGGEAPGNGLRSAWAYSPPALHILSAIGLISVIAAPVTSSRLTLARALAIIPWLIIFLTAVATRPRKTPKTLLALYISVLTCKLGALAVSYRGAGRVDALQCLLVGTAFAAIVVILNMPMRDPAFLPESTLKEIAEFQSPPDSKHRSPEDNITLWQFMTVSWLRPLIERGYRKQLNNEDVWLLPYEFQHARLYKLFQKLQGSLTVRLVKANGLDLMISTLLGTIETCIKVSLPMLLQLLLRSIKNGPAYRYESISYSAITMVLRLVAAQSGVLNTWFSRRGYERTRGQTLTTIYGKTLTRKSVGGVIQEPESENGHENGNGTTGANGQARRLRLLDFLWPCKCGSKKKTKAQKKSKKKSKKKEQPASMGKILNLMKNDAYQVAQRFWEFYAIVTKPLQLILSLVLIWNLLGWPCLFGIAWVALVQLANAACVRRLLVVEKIRRAVTDERLKITGQFIEAIRPLRWYDWQDKWLENIMTERTEELRKRIVTGLWSIGIGTTNFAAAALFPIFTFFAYTYIAGKPLPVEVAFPALQLFALLEQSFKEVPALITTLLNASIAMGRLESFLAEPDKEESGEDQDPPDFRIGFENATLAWPGNHKPVLKNLNFQFDRGFTLVCGKVGSGKTALLQGILGELDQQEGRCFLPTEMVGYCAQSPWIQNMSIRDNILFNFPLDQARYQKVLEACALIPDLNSFKNGDLTNIGENGVGLSGGQKARVALARAVYSNSRYLLLDDPLAALDHQTAEFIVQKLLQGPLVEGRTVILVTHRVDLCLRLTKQVLEVEDGHVRFLEGEDFEEEIHNLAQEPEPQQIEEQDSAVIVEKFIEDEKRASGGVVAKVYWTYIKAGKLKSWALLIAIFALLRFIMVVNSWFLKAWGEAYEAVEAHQHMIKVSMYTSSLENPIVAHVNSDNGTDSRDQLLLFDGLPNPTNDVKPWLMLYAIIGLVTSVLSMLSQCGLLLILYVAAKDLFERVIKRVSGASFRFYDVTPIGRLMNRLTSDIGMIDGGSIQPLQDVAVHAITWGSCMVVIALATPVFFAFALGMTVGFFLIFRRFLPTSQSLRRLEMVSLSPLMSNFGILVDGLATIRAFRAQPHFQKRNIEVTDAFQKMDHFFWSLQAWLMFRFDTLSALSTFVLTVLALYQGLSPGLAAFVLTTASQFVDATHALCKVYGQLQMDFVSVERVVELLDVEQEPDGDIEPPAAWPTSNDAIHFDHVTLRYAPGLDPSLRDVSFTIPGGSTCAVIGRTGSGKSTLALAMLAAFRPDKGTMRVGSVDISRVKKRALRKRVTFVAQDPVLFPGTLRENLDPLDEHTDAECADVLCRVLGGEWTIESRVDVAGRNLSQGQRQLVGIGRAMLRRSPVVILDEATASIDRATAENIQAILRQELRYSTVITVAHRIEAVRDADYFVRLDEGGVEECGPVTGALMPNTNTNSTSTNTPAASAATTTTTTSTSDDDAAAGAAT